MPTRLLCCTSTMESGGSERQMVQLMNHLDRRRITPNLYLTYRTGPLLANIRDDVSIESFATADASRYALVPGALFGLQIRRIRSVLRRSNIDVTYDRLYHTVMLGAFASRGLSVARVVTVVSPPAQDFGRSHQRWKSIKRSILSYSYRTATRLLAVSEESAIDAATFYNIPIERWQIVPSPIDFATVVNNGTQPAPQNFRRADGLNIVMVGRLSKEKNHELLLNIVASFQRKSAPVHLHIVGDGILRPALESQVAQLDIESNVTFYGVQSNPHAIISQCDCLVLPSLYEGFPNVVMEAMACKVPVLASNRAGGLKALVGDNERGWLLDPADQTAWQMLLQSFCENPSLMRSKIDEAAAYVRDNHDLPKWVHDMEDIFIDAAGDKRSAKD